MKTFITLAIICTLLTATAAVSMNQAIKELVQKKNQLTKSEEILKAHGGGIDDGQETTAVNAIDQAIQNFRSDIYANSLYIQEKVSEAFGGKWNVEVFGNDPSWGRATHIHNDEWILLFGYGEYEWDYIIWAPEC